MASSKYKKAFKEKNAKEIKPGPGVLSRKLCAFWKDQVNLADRANAKWLKRGNTIIKRYRDERSRADEGSTRRMNILWTNIKILAPAIYSKCPTVVAERKYLTKDPVGRLSAQILERVSRSEIEVNDFHDVMRRSVLDYLLPGRGQVWVRYEPEIGKSESIVSTGEAFEDELHDIQDEFDVKDSDKQATDQLESTGDQVVAEKAPVDYMDWKDFYVFPPTARTWEEVQAVGKAVFISKHEAIERFGEEIGEEMQPDIAQSGDDSTRLSLDISVLHDINNRNIKCIEIWNKTDRRVYWISSGYEYLADCRDDPLKLKNFFPCPKPLTATFTNDTIIPVPDYWEWQDQAIQIDELTQRIAMLSKACKIAGTYDAANGALKRLLSESVENELIPVDSWAAHGDKGGVPGSISFLPIKEIQEVIRTLTEVRQNIKQDLDEITGLSDIVRGTSDSRETLGGIRLKNNNAGTRLDDRKNDVARFCKDTIEIVAEVMCKHFDDKTLIDMSGVLLNDELQPEAVMAEFRSDMEIKLMAMPAFAKLMNGEADLQQIASPMPPDAQQMPAGGGLPPPPMPMPGGMPMPVPQPAPDPKQMFAQMLEQQMAQITPDMLIQKKVGAALALLRNEIERGYRIDIETDSTIWADQAQERADATEYISAVTQFLSAAVEVGSLTPEAIPMLGRLLQFGSRKFRTGRDVESSIDEFVQKMDKKAKEMENSPPPPSPEQQKADAEIAKIKETAKLEAANDQRQAAVEALRQNREAAMQEAEDKRNAANQQAADARQAALDNLAMEASREKHRIEMDALARQEIVNQAEHTRALELIEKKHQAALEVAKQKEKQAKMKPKAPAARK